jgi:hypothetical protein
MLTNRISAALEGQSSLAQATQSPALPEPAAFTVFPTGLTPEALQQLIYQVSYERARAAVQQAAAARRYAFSLN